MSEIQARILVVDDDRAVRSALRVNLAKAGYDVRLVRSAEEAIGKALATLVCLPPRRAAPPAENTQHGCVLSCGRRGLVPVSVANT